MSEPFHIQFNNMERVGSLTVTQPGEAFGGSWLASGLRIHVPARITLGKRSNGTSLLVENLQATFFAASPAGIEIEIGTARCMDTIQSGWRDRNITFAWDWTYPALAYYEKLRGANAPFFHRVSLAGDLRVRLTGDEEVEVWSLPERIFYHTAVRYSRDAWIKTLRNLQVKDTVLVEIPFPTDPPEPWQSVFDALADARTAFDIGATTGWQQCVTAIRGALEQWQKLEPEDHGPGWIAPKRDEKETRTRQQRLDNLRWDLLQCAHQAAHTRADKWTRDDALFALATFSALLALRNP